MGHPISTIFSGKTALASAVKADRSYDLTPRPQITWRPAGRNLGSDSQHYTPVLRSDSVQMALTRHPRDSPVGPDPEFTPQSKGGLPAASMALPDDFKAVNKNGRYEGVLAFHNQPPCAASNQICEKELSERCHRKARRKYRRALSHGIFQICRTVI